MSLSRRTSLFSRMIPVSFVVLMSDTFVVQQHPSRLSNLRIFLCFPLTPFFSGRPALRTNARVVRCWRYPPRDSLRILDGYGAPQPAIPFASASRYLPHGNVGNRTGDDCLWVRGGGFCENWDGYLGAFQCRHWGKVLR